MKITLYLLFISFLSFCFIKFIRANITADETIVDIPYKEVIDIDVEDETQLKKEKHDFQAEVPRLLDIIVNSLYQSREIFLRELLSNAADALEKFRFLSLADPSLFGDEPNLDIKIDFNKEKKILTITDTGIGMTKNDLINNLGTVAKSGTTNFLESLAQQGDINLVGQFGVGFYASYLVAEKVVVISKNNDDDQYIWESSADTEFKIAKDPRGNTLKRGTRIILHLKDDALEFLDKEELMAISKKYSQFTAYPIFVRTDIEDVIEVDKPVESDEEKSDDESSEDVEVETEKKVLKEKKVIKRSEWLHINMQKALWLRNRQDVKEEEYKALYQSLFDRDDSPLLTLHFTGEGEVEFKSILFIPSRSNDDYYESISQNSTSLVKLYVRRVLIADRYTEILPKYFFFVRGIVDSDDLPVNVARDQLQQSKIIKVIEKKLVRKIIESLRKLEKDSSDLEKDLLSKLEQEVDEEKKKGLKDELEKIPFKQFYSNFATSLKMGCYEDNTNRLKFVKLLRFASSTRLDNKVTLDEYVARMPESQRSIYYAFGPSIEKLNKLPQMQIFLKKNIEVLYLLDPMDDPCFQRLEEFEGKKLESVEKSDITLQQTEDEIELEKQLQKVYEPLLKYWKNLLGSEVMDVVLSKRLTVDPCTIVAGKFGVTGYVEKIIKNQAFQDKSAVLRATRQRILEINPHHSLIYQLLLNLQKDEKDEKLKKQCQLLFEASLFASGYDVDMTESLSSALYRGMMVDSGVNPENTYIDIPIPSNIPNSNVESAKPDIVNDEL